LSAIAACNKNADSGNSAWQLTESVHGVYQIPYPLSRC